MDSTSLLLKKETLAAHQQTEKIIINEIKQIENPNDYLILLQKFYIFYKKMEELSVPFLDEKELNFSFEKYSDALALDIQSFDVNLPSLDLLDAVSIRSKEEALMVQYVMMGSSLGRPYIAKMIRAKNITGTFHFFDATNEDSMNHWSQFKTMMDAQTEFVNKSYLIDFSNKIFNTLVQLFQHAAWENNRGSK